MAASMPPDSAPPQTQEISLSDELAVYAAVAGITLSHDSMPVVGTANPLDGLMVLLSVGLVISILFVHIDNRFNTEHIGLTIARNLTVLISVYLIGNSISGLFSQSPFILSGDHQCVITLALFVTILFSALAQRFKMGGFDDRAVGEYHESRSDWTNKSKNLTNIAKGLFVSIPFVVLAIGNPIDFVVPVGCGILSAVVVPAIWGSIFFRSNSLERIERNKANAVLIWPGCILIFLLLFSGATPPYL